MGYSALSNGTWLTWTPTYTGFSAAPTDATARYTLNGKMCSVYHYSGAGGTSNATSFTITLPFNAKYLAAHSMCIGVDNGTGQNSYVRTVAGSNILNCYRTATTITWTGSGTKSIYFSFTYEIE